VLVADRYSAKAFTGRPISVVPNYPLLTSVEGTADRRNKTRKLMGRCPFSEDEKRIHAVTNVRYLGNQNLRAVYQHIAEADLGLLLLQPVPAYAYPGENTLKLFEYMWCELRLVSSDFPNLRQIIEAAQCGICIDPCNAERATVAIMNLLDQPELRQQMGPTVAMRSFGL
jgi:glycosyltransferase involved in cell wall biosynthesis